LKVASLMVFMRLLPVRADAIGIVAGAYVEAG
jgi:hypothetical protein